MKSVNQIKDYILEQDIKKVYNYRDFNVKYITNDTRSIRENTLLFAFSGIKTNSNLLLHNLDCNDVCIISDGIKLAIEKINKNNVIIIVKNIRQIISRISGYFYDFPSTKCLTIGVTGTNGKTTIAYMTRHLLNKFDYEPMMLGTIEYSYKDNVVIPNNTTPGPLELNKFISENIKNGSKSIIMEVSSHALSQYRVDDISFDIGIFTNLTQDHLDYHETLEAYYNAKKKLFELIVSNKKSGNNGFIINIDDEFGKRLKNELEDVTSIPIITISFSKAAIIRVLNYKTNCADTYLEFKYQNNIYKTNIELIGFHNIQNYLCALSVGILMKKNVKNIISALSDFIQVPGRLEKIYFKKKNVYIYVDYAHTPDALENVLKTLKGIKHNRILTVVGAGGDRDRTKRPIMGRIGEKYSDLLFITSDNPRTENPDDIIEDILNGLTDKSNEKLLVLSDRKKAIHAALDKSTDNDIILIAGKGHEDYQIIGTEKTFFSDRVVVEDYIKERVDT